jgi:Flp pilus assembly protein TadG
MVVFLKDQRGTVLVQILMLLPVLLIIAVGGFEVWKIVYVRQTLTEAAYQGVRLLAFQPVHDNILFQTEALIRRTVAGNHYVGANAYDPGLLAVELDVDPRCGHEVRVKLRLQWTVGQGLGRPGGSWFPFLGRTGRLKAEAYGWVICERESDGQQ